MARLHIICGNCGCSDSFVWEHYYKMDEDTPGRVNLLCENCSTIHNLGDNAEPKVPE